jgi:hypothetical protein
VGIIMLMCGNGCVIFLSFLPYLSRNLTRLSMIHVVPRKRSPRRRPHPIRLLRKTGHTHNRSMPYRRRQRRKRPHPTRRTAPQPQMLPKTAHRPHELVQPRPPLVLHLPDPPETQFAGVLVGREVQDDVRGYWEVG